MSHIRASMLPIARHCGYAVELAARYPEGSDAAERGTKWHERMADFLRGRIEAPELESIRACIPAHVKVEAEVPVELRDPDTGELLVKGTVDAVFTLASGSVIVADWKTGQPSRVDPASDNLQLAAYALAVALERGAPSYQPVLYFTEYGFDWGAWVPEGEYGDVLGRIVAAANNDRSRPVVGQHCDKCFSRKHCSAFMLPAHEGETALAPFVEGGGLTKDNAPRALVVVQAMKQAVELAEARLKDFAREHGGIYVEGKVWGPRQSHGRRSISVERVEEAGLLPQLEAAGCVSPGRPYEVFAWKNASAVKTAKSDEYDPISATAEAPKKRRAAK